MDFSLTEEQITLQLKARAFVDKYIKNASPLTDIIWDSCLQESNIETPEGKAGFETLLRRKLNLISDKSIKKHYGLLFMEMLDKFFYSKKKESLPTGTCLILITPDSERTMCTFLGTAGKINEKDIDVDSVKNSDLLFLEG